MERRGGRTGYDRRGTRPCCGRRESGSPRCGPPSHHIVPGNPRRRLSPRARHRRARRRTARSTETARGSDRRRPRPVPGLRSVAYKPSGSRCPRRRRSSRQRSCAGRPHRPLHASSDGIEKRLGDLRVGPFPRRVGEPRLRMFHVFAVFGRAARGIVSPHGAQRHPRLACTAPSARRRLPARLSSPVSRSDAALDE